MALEPAVQGDRHTGQAITWWAGDQKKSLVGATITGKIINPVTGVATAISGTLTITDGPNGLFQWAYSAADVATVGTFKVQFTATFTLSDSSFETDWVVYKKY